MKEVSNTTIMVLLIIGIVVSFGGAMLNLNRLAQMGLITGYATASTLNVTVTSYKAVAVTGDIDFGSGYVTSGVGAWMDSGGTSTTNGSWTWSAQYFTIENQGNAAGAVTANASQNPATWIGTDGQARINGTEPGSDNGCSGGSQAMDVLNTTNAASICTSLAGLPNTADTIWAHARIYVPGTVASGAEKWTNVTFYIT